MCMPVRQSSAHPKAAATDRRAAVDRRWPPRGGRRREDRLLEALYRDHSAAVYQYALATLTNPVDAEDVTQTTFMNAYAALQRGQTPERPRNWLIAIAHNVCRQRFRQSTRRVQEVPYEEELNETAAVDPDSPTAEDVLKALSTLPFNQRAALVMREVEDRSSAERRLGAGRPRPGGPRPHAGHSSGPCRGVAGTVPGLRPA